MCGILGSFSRMLVSTAEQQAQASLHAMYHRGPDDKGLEIIDISGGQLILGQSRLSIIDLSAGGHQPMQSRDERYSIVFNGEIYNYRELREELRAYGHSFYTESDTEVLLAAWSQWQTGCMPRLRGMFAFALFDRAEESLTLVRDAFGIKPLNYFRNKEMLALASEIPALLKLLPAKPKPNPQRVYEYLVLGSYDDRDDSFYEQVYQLKPGYFLSIKLSDITTGEPQRWWWPSIEERTDMSFKKAAEQLREMFLNNIRLHLRSDVPLGAALSGGIDSSSVVCGIRHIEPKIPIHTFSFIAQGSEVNEERWIDIVNQSSGAIPHKVVVDPQELGHDLDDIIRAQGEPFGDTSIYAQYRVFRLAREHGITVTLDGQGADELLAGYNGYPQRYLQSLIEKKQYHKIPGFLNAWSKWPGRNSKQAIRTLMGLLVSRQTKNLLGSLLGKTRQQSGWLKTEWFMQQGIDMAAREQVFGEGAHGRRVVEELRYALTNQGLPALMRHADRNSMRWSIESRVPFLTTDLAEFLLSLPEQYLISQKGETKSVLREAMRGIVPDAILDRRDKIGFETPEQVWLKGQQSEIKYWLEGLTGLPFINETLARKEIDDVLNSKKPYNTEAWRLINFSRWMQLQ